VAYSAGIARRLRRQHRVVYAYGESAGGTLASLLAEKGLVEAAATQAPIADLPYWLSTTPDPALSRRQTRLEDPATATELSPATHATKAPILAEAPAEDALSPFTFAWGARDRLVKAVRVPGAHLDLAYYGGNVTKAIHYLAIRRSVDRRHRAKH